MPPRARKTATPAPSLEDAAQQENPAEEPAAKDAGEVSPESVTGADATAENATAAEDDALDSDGGTDQGPGADGDNSEEPATAEVEPPAFHWESVKNDGTPPCHLCVPGGPPPGVGVFGCTHGQWVRVQDAA